MIPQNITDPLIYLFLFAIIICLVLRDIHPSKEMYKSYWERGYRYGNTGGNFEVYDKDKMNELFEHNIKDLEKVGVYFK